MWKVKGMRVKTGNGILGLLGGSCAVMVTIWFTAFIVPATAFGTRTVLVKYKYEVLIQAIPTYLLAAVLSHSPWDHDEEDGWILARVIDSSLFTKFLF